MGVSGAIGINQEINVTSHIWYALITFLVILLLSFWAGELTGTKNLGEEATEGGKLRRSSEKVGEVNGQEAQDHHLFCLIIKQNGSSQLAGLVTLYFDSNRWTWNLEYCWVRFQWCIKFCWLLPTEVILEFLNPSVILLSRAMGKCGMGVRTWKGKIMGLREKTPSSPL